MDYGQKRQEWCGFSAEKNMYGSSIHVTVCTGATANIFDDGKRAIEQKLEIDSLKDNLDWYKRQVDHLREVRHDEALALAEKASVHENALYQIRIRLDSLGKIPEASVELSFLVALDALLKDAGFPKFEPPAVVNAGL